MKTFFANLKYNLPASVVVFFVALPLCLGIALASGAPLFSGIISGVVGGIIVGFFSNSALGVSGPAAGLATIVCGYIAALDGSYQTFLLAVVIAGIIQVIAGYLKCGSIAYYFPSSVIRGMLAGIGLIIIIKQIPHALGYDVHLEGDLIFNKSFADFRRISGDPTPASTLISAVSMSILILWETVLSKKHKIFQVIQGPLVVVILGVIFYNLFQSSILPFTLSESQVVNIPVSSSWHGLFSRFITPDFSQFLNIKVYLIALGIALVASIETLLSVEAVDKIDPYKRVTATNQELKAQGLGNIISGLIGGLPVVQVIVRSSTNATFGARSKDSTILHGFFLLIAAIAIPNVLNMIPLASLACVLLLVGYKLTRPAIFIKLYQLGWEHFLPFIATIIGILLTDLLQGVGIGMLVAIYFVLHNNIRNSYHRINEESRNKKEHVIKLGEVVSFLNKGTILQLLKNIPNNSQVN